MRLSICVVVALWTFTAQAESVAPAPSAQAQKQAKLHYQKGAELYSLGKYADAKVEFEAAYATAPLPGFHFNLAQCLRLTDQKTAAIEHYQKYISSFPDGAPADESRRWITELTRELDAKTFALAEKSRLEKEKIENARLEKERQERNAREADERARAEEAARLAAAPKPKPLYKKWWLWTTVGIVVVAAGVGVGVGLALTAQGPFNRSLPDLGPGSRMALGGF